MNKVWVREQGLEVFDQKGGVIETPVALSLGRAPGHGFVTVPIAAFRILAQTRSQFMSVLRC